MQQGANVPILHGDIETGTGGADNRESDNANAARRGASSSGRGQVLTILRNTPRCIVL